MLVVVALAVSLTQRQKATTFSPGACATLDFTAPQEYGTGLQAGPITAADMNRDGRQDLITVGANGVSILLGDGTGGFLAPATFGSAGGDMVLTADFNLDGKKDVATPRAILLGNGDGTLQQPLAVISGTAPTFAIVGDWNGDSKPDLAVTELRAFVLWILIGNGDGTFQPAVSYDVGPLPTSVAAGDLNGDGKVDLVVTDAPKALPQENGPGSGFVECGGESTGGGGGPSERPLRLSTATFTYGDSPNLSVLLGNGDGTFQSAQNFGDSGISLQVVVEDFNGDGRLDIVDMNVGVVRVRFGNGDGTFQAPVTYTAGDCSKALYARDFNADGNLDLITADQGSRSVSILIGNGDGTFQALQRFNVWRAPSSVAIADFNNDGWLDLAAPHKDQENPTLQNGIAVRLNHIAHIPPTIGGPAISPTVLSPANHQLIPVTVDYAVSDNCDSASVGCALTVSSNEPITGTGPGDKSPDWQVIDAHHVQLRAEKAKNGNGRVYSVTITCTDLHGNSANQVAQVAVP